MTTAFVHSGGGSLGAVQVGMLQALGERGVTPDLLVGTSAGALNAVFVAAHGMSPACSSSSLPCSTRALLRTAFDLLAFRMSNVVFSVVVGLLLLVLGAYGRISGNLPANNPYARAPSPRNRRTCPRAGGVRRGGRPAGGRDRRRPAPRHRGSATPGAGQSGVLTRDGRRRIWMAFDETAGPALRGGPELGVRR